MEVSVLLEDESTFFMMVRGHVVSSLRSVIYMIVSILQAFFNLFSLTLRCVLARTHLFPFLIQSFECLSLCQKTVKISVKEETKQKLNNLKCQIFVLV